MKQIILFLALSFYVAACNSGSETDNNSQSDSVDHSAHNNMDNNSSGENHMKAMHDHMNGMMEDMKNMKPSGDPDYDFAMMMKHHHQGAINMAKSEVAGGTDAELKQKAQKMIDEQQSEIAVFDKFLGSTTPSGRSDFGQKAMGMMTPMSEIKMEGGSLDAMFASMMIPHHQDAVKMSQEYLKVGKNAELTKLAQDMISSQQKEIDELQNWLNNHKK